MDNLPRYWRTEKVRYSLIGEICYVCRQPIFPPRDICPYCGKEAEPKKLTPENQTLGRKESKC